MQPGPEPVSQVGAAWRRAFLALSVVMLAAVLVAVASKVALVYAVTSDDTTGVLEAQSFLKGNLLLRGWTMSNISFYATDLPFYVAAVASFGPRPSLMRDVPVAIYAVTVFFAALLARGPWRSVRGAAAVVSVVVMLGLPAGGLAEFVTKAYIRAGTTLGLLVAFWVLDPRAGRRPDLARLMVFALILALTIMSDSAALVIGGVAVLAVCVWGAIGGANYEEVRLGRVAAAAFLGMATGVGLTWLIPVVGGYHLIPFPLRFNIPYPNTVQALERNARAATSYLPLLYRCVEVQPPAIRILCGIGPILTLIALVMGLPIPLRRRRAPADFIADILRASMAICLAAYLISANLKGREESRYLLPFVLMGGALVGRVLAGRVASPRLAALTLGLLGLLGLAYGVTVAGDLRKPVATNSVPELAQWLESRGLRHGYGPYWDASIVTVTSRNRVTVRAIRVRPRQSKLVMEPFQWMSNTRWYEETPARFVVYKADPGIKNGFGVNESNCEQYFGPPRSRHRVGPYVVLVWDHDLSPILAHGLSWVP